MTAGSSLGAAFGAATLADLTAFALGASLGSEAMNFVDLTAFSSGTAFTVAA